MRDSRLNRQFAGGGCDEIFRDLNPPRLKYSRQKIRACRKNLRPAAKVAGAKRQELRGQRALSGANVGVSRSETGYVAFKLVPVLRQAVI